VQRDHDELLSWPPGRWQIGGDSRLCPSALGSFGQADRTAIDSQILRRFSPISCLAPSLRGWRSSAAPDLIVQSLARAVSAGNWPKVHAVADRLSVHVAVAA
jgi:hypothetical protein